MNTKILIFSFILIVTIITSLADPPLTQAPAEGGSFGGEFNNIQDVQNVINNGATAHGTVPSDTTVYEDGVEFQIGGDVSTNNRAVSADQLRYTDSYGETNMQDVEYFRVTEDGYTLNNVEQLTQNGITLIKAQGVIYSNGILKAQHADSVVKSGSATTNIDNLEINTQTFSVQKADSFLASGITVSSIENTEFEIGISYILMKAKKGTTLHIMGIGYIESDFEAFSNDSEIRVSKDKPEYGIKNGRLNYSSSEYTDSIETNSTAKIEIDEYGFGFKCMLLGIKSTYWYNDKKDLRKDFGINVPDYGIEYGLCIKRLKNIEYKEFDGLVDFIDKRIFLGKVVNYLRYPLKNNQIASLLSSFVYKGLKDINTIFSYDNELIFLNSIFLTNKNRINGNLSIAYPSNYYTIKEMEVDGEVHSIIQLNLIKKEDAAQNINYEYKTDYFKPVARINGNVLVQDNDKNKIIIFPPEHEKISEMLK